MDFKQDRNLAKVSELDSNFEFMFVFFHQTKSNSFIGGAYKIKLIIFKKLKKCKKINFITHI